ncbi:uncharacterized protein LOC108598842 isoform X2 [Drosophila busckii]|nr:uncharacterized protein LOC108598842 isoform X2 [Drosophila busckii]
MATNAANFVPAAGIQEAIPIWKKIDWSEEVEQGIYKDWGAYYSRRDREDKAMYYYDKALELAPEDFVTLSKRSMSKRKTAKVESALSDSRAAKDMSKNMNKESAFINLEVCEGIYQHNELENAKAALHENTQIFKGNKIQAFVERLIVVDENLKDTCGDGLSPFFLENEKHIYEIKKILDEKMMVDNRPLWKILKEQGKCDVLSIPDIEEEILSPLEIARRKRAFEIFNQIYIDKSWIDVLFLKSLKSNKNLLMDEFKESKDILTKLTTSEYEIVMKFLKMNHVRCPLYANRYQQYPNKEALKKFQEAYLYRVQYQTRRTMLAALRTIRILRAKSDVNRLLNVVESVMGDYVVVKTHRVMPWKFEFIAEVYNTVALTLSEQYTVPNNFKVTKDNALLTLLRHQMDTVKDFPKFKFGDRSTHQEPDLTDPNMLRSRRMISRLEMRMRFAKYSIEKCYLLYQIANIHLKSNRGDECSFAAHKAIEDTCMACNKAEYQNKKSSFQINASRRESKLSTVSLQRASKSSMISRGELTRPHSLSSLVME